MKKLTILAGLLLPLSKRRPAARHGKLFRRLALVTVIGVAVFTSIGTTSAHIDSLAPNQWTAGGPAFTLRILGTGIDESDTGRVLSNGTRVPATLIKEGTPGELQATIPASLILSPGIVKVELDGFPPSADFTINPHLMITSTSPLPDAVPGQPYSQRLEVSGGTARFTWSGTLPANSGLSLSPDGLISGTTSPVGTAFEFQATVTDAATVRVVKNFLIRIRFPCAGSCLFIGDTQVTEGDTGPVAAVFTVRLDPSSSFPVTVIVSTQDFTAASPNDYTARSGPLTFNSGETLKSIAIPVSGDTLYEAHEQFYVNLTNPVNATIGRGQGICTISDDEPGSFTICADDVPKRADVSSFQAESTIDVNREGMIDDVNVSLFLEQPLSGNSASVSLLRLGEDRRLFNSPRQVARGPVLGTTCSPSPNCIFDDEVVTSYEDGSQPLIGSFMPFSRLAFFSRQNARGAWTLRFGGGGLPQINCWCLKFDLPREGCKLIPERATAPIFFPHTVRVILTSNGAPVTRFNQVVRFTVRGEQDELRLSEDVTVDSEFGVAKLSYYDFRPGRNFIEAQTIIDGVPSIAKAEVTWVANGLSGLRLCPVEESTASAPEAETTLSATRGFRDDVLARTPRGQAYTRLYYEFSTEAVQIMMFNPMLMLRSREIIERYKPLVKAMTNGERVTLTRGDLEEIDALINSFAAKGGPELQEAIEGVRHELRDPKMHEEFGITVTDGPKRDLPAHDQLQAIKQMGGPAIFFGLCGLVFFAATGNRRKALRRHAPPMLVVLLSAAVLANSSSQWSEVTGQTRNSGRWSVVSDQSSNADLTASISAQPAQSRVAEGSQRHPIAFEPNQGQIDSQVKFVSRGQGYTMFLTSTEAVMSLRRHKVKGKRQKWELPQQTTDHQPLATDVLRMKLIGPSPRPKITGLDRLPSVSNYLIGNDPSQSRANVLAFARVKYEDVYPGVDMLYYGSQQRLEYDFIVAPGADPGAIGLAFDGADKIEVDAAGDLVLSMSGGEVRQRKPVIYQEMNGSRKEIPGRYTLIHNPKSIIQNQIVRFEICEYDRTRPLVIYPVLEYSTYLGGRGNDEGNAITVDATGNAYVIGFTDSINFPLANAPQPTLGGGLQDVFVAKLDPTGTQLLYSTYIGGNGQDNGSAIAVDAAGNAYVTGYTGSTNFPAMNAMQPAKNGRFNAFVAKLNPAGALLYSTHLGGSTGDFGSSIAVDSSGNIYVAGVATSPNFPMVNAIQPAVGGAADVYVAKFNPSGSQLLYSTYLGGVATMELQASLLIPRAMST